jgi:O-antigen ligase
MSFGRDALATRFDARLRPLHWQSATSQLLAAVAVGVILGFLLPRLPLFLALGIVPAVLVAWGMTLRPELGLLLIMAITGGLVNYDQLPYLSMGPISFHVTDLLLLYLLGIAVVRLLLERDFCYVSTRLDVPFFLFYGAAVLSVLTAILQFGLRPNIAIREFRIFTYWLAFFAVTQLIRTEQQLNVLVNGFFVLAILMTGVVLLQMAMPGLPLVRVSAETLVTAGKAFKGVSRVWITGERLIYVMLIVAICLWLFARSTRQRWVYGSVVLILFLWLFLSYQRNYWLTTVLALGLLGLVIPWRERLRGLRWMLLALAVVALLFALPGSPLAPWGEAALDRLFSLEGDRLERDMSAILRQAEIEYAKSQVLKHPLFGVGIGNVYRPWIRRFDYRPDVYSYTSRGLTWYCHNAYMWIWVKMGTPGLLFFLWLCLKFVYRGFRQWKQVPEPKWRAVVLGFTLAFIGQAVSNMVAPNFIQNWVLVVYPMMMGINELVFKWNETNQI